MLAQARRQFPAVLITGPRQSGKTTFLRDEGGHGTHYLTFDDPAVRELARRDPEGFLDRGGDAPTILDEIQYVPELLQYLKIRIDRDRQRYGRWLLTGSQQFSLMAGVSESLAGRIALLELLPFSLLETTGLRAEDLASVLWAGSYPEPALDPAKRERWLPSYVTTYIERDVRQLRNIQDLRAFETFLGLCAARHARLLSMAEIARDLGISQPTVKGWLGALEAGYIVHLLQPYFTNLGKRLVRSPKLYFLDAAIVTYLTRQPSAEAALAGAMGGALFEGLIVSEAIKVFTNLGRRADVFFWRSHDGLEIDLLIQAGGLLHPVEIKLTATPTAKHAEPLDRFRELAGSLAAPRGVVVCRAPERRPLPHGNLALPWAEFPAWLEERLTEF